MKTVLQKIQKRLDIEIKFINNDDSQADIFYQQGLKLAFSICNEYLDEEKQQIINSATHGANFDKSPFKNAEDYYNKTFK